jgi:hypothetical protein
MDFASVHPLQKQVWCEKGFAKFGEPGGVKRRFLESSIAEQKFPEYF